MTRVALYARYSSDQQREASIEDQLRLCRLHAEKQGWTVADRYQDRAVSGASLIRPGIQALLADALRGRFEVVLAEALDRISGDQEDVAGRLQAHGLRQRENDHPFGRGNHAPARGSEGHREYAVLEGPR
jgi:site-specific DNA recombinase